jgi:hypothetical protein
MRALLFTDVVDCIRDPSIVLVDYCGGLRASVARRLLRAAGSPGRCLSACRVRPLSWRMGWALQILAASALVSLRSPR